MKHTLLIAFAICSLQSFAQPQAINYQGIARDAQGIPLVNHSISLRLSILDSSATGQVVYVETQSATTSSSGLFNIGIGLGTVVSGTFANILWGQGNKWLKTEMDTTGGSNYQLIGTTQFLSVPYALHANTASSIQTNTINIFSMVSNKTLNTFSFWDAMNYCYNLTEGGFSDWRLPTLEEIQNYTQLNGLPNLITWTLTKNFQSLPIGNSSLDASHFYVSLKEPANNFNSRTSVVSDYASFPIQCVR